MATPDVQMPVVEALIRWLNPRWFIKKMKRNEMPWEGMSTYKQHFSFSDDVYYILLIPLDEKDGDVWYSPNELFDSDESRGEELRLNPFTHGNYQLQPTTYEEFEGDRGSIYLTIGKGSDHKILWLPESVLEENGRFTVDSGFENQRFEYWDSYNDWDKPEIFFVSDYLGQIPSPHIRWPQPESRDLLNWEVVPETLLRRLSDD
jgi:hypothetical protein